MSTVFFDVDTQFDFMFPAGALYAGGAEQILPHVIRLNQWARSNQIPLISTADAHAEADPEFKTWPAHCVLGTWGQHKPEATLARDAVAVNSSADLPGAAGASQVVLNKQSVDCFTADALIPLLDSLKASHVIVYGLVTEVCVRHAVLGLRRWGAEVSVVKDAIQPLTAEAGDAAVTEFLSAGASIISTAEICG